jgi:ketosteroid isomerase-like protein
MSRETPQTLRNAYEAWNRGDLESILEVISPEIELRMSGLFPGLEPAYYGHEGFRRFWEQFRGAWERIWIEVDRIVESGDEIVALFRFHGWGREGIEVQRPFAHFWTIRDGRFARMQAYADQDEALRAIASTGRR